MMMSQYHYSQYRYCYIVNGFTGSTIIVTASGGWRYLCVYLLTGEPVTQEVMLILAAWATEGWEIAIGT